MAALRKLTIMYGSYAIMAPYFLFSRNSFRMFLSDRVMDMRNKSVVDFFFTPLGDMFKCTCNKRVKQPGKKGYTNLMSHLKNVHKDSWEDEYRRSKTKEQAVLPYPKVNKKAENNFRWLEWAILENSEYSFVGKWSLGLMPFGLKSLGLIQLVTWLNFFKLSVSGIGHLA